MSSVIRETSSDSPDVMTCDTPVPESGGSGYSARYRLANATFSGSTSKCRALMVTS